MACQQSRAYAAILQRSAAADPRRVASLHAAILKPGLLACDQFLANHLLIAYFRSPLRPRRHGLRLLDEMPRRNAVSWAAAVSGLAHGGRPREALALFRAMRREGAPPSEFALVSALNASSLVAGGPHAHARQLHALAVRLGFESHAFVLNAFLAAMVRHERLADAVRLFQWASGRRDVVSWNTLLAGLARRSRTRMWILWRRMAREGAGADGFSFSTVLSGLTADADTVSGLQVHGQLVKSGFGDDVCVGNSLVEMYTKNGALESGAKAFAEMPQRDVVSWTEMAAGWLHCGEPAKAIGVLGPMMLEGIRPNNYTLATAANACATLAGPSEGRKVHGYAIRLGEGSDVAVNNALIDMYSKCGLVDTAHRVFQSMRQRPVISWTTMIMGFARNGQPQDAVKVFDDMLLEGVAPNHVTFLCVLHACSQGGFMEEAWIYFRAMADKFGVEPGEDHYACMVDLLGKAGHIEDAEELISRMPFRPGVLVWQALLGACQLHGNEAAAKRAAERALALEKEDPSTYLLLSRTLASRHDWGGAGRSRGLMGDREVMKLPGSTWLQSMPETESAQACTA
ncbi:pentatricopeptide repeat-containing protein At4g33170-like [Aegilops tauschii subsp. strangulata]|nr:pentatricopeptide repeat-containing protein At4g33170-like [Aegilops tauschii subsp. strangulata]